MKSNYYISRIIESALTSNSKIILPENDSRVDKAKIELIDMGFNIFEVDNFRSNTNEYIQLLSKKKFTEKEAETTL